MQKNAFGKEVPSMAHILSSWHVGNFIEHTLEKVLEHLEVDDPGNGAREIKRLASLYEGSEYEARAHDFLERIGAVQAFPEKLEGRANLIYQQIRDQIKGPRVLDFGTGDGQVGARLAQEGYEVTLADVYKHPNIDSTGLPFILMKQGERLPSDEGYDTVVALTVLHHSSHPEESLWEAAGLTNPGGNLVLIESVYGISPDAEINWPLDETSQSLTEGFTHLSKDDQFTFGVFFDHFYNRVVHYNENESRKVNVPFNFAPSEAWNLLTPLNVRNTTNLGIDQPIVPEFHTLHVYSRLTGGNFGKQVDYRAFDELI